MALRFETRDEFWNPQTHQKQLAEALIKATTQQLFRKALLQPPIQAPLPDEKLCVATICTDSTDTLRATFYSEITITATVLPKGPAHVQLFLHFPENFTLLCDQDEHPTNLITTWGDPIPTPRRTEQFQPSSLSFTTSAEYFQHKIAESDNLDFFYPNDKGNLGFIKPRKSRLAFQSTTRNPSTSQHTRECNIHIHHPQQSKKKIYTNTPDHS